MPGMTAIDHFRDPSGRTISIMLLAHTFLLLALIVGYPIGKLIWNSFFDLRLSGGGGAKFVGRDNHALVLKDVDGWNAASNSGLLTLITVPAALALGMGRRGWPTCLKC